jgi:hypothetical protein
VYQVAAAAKRPPMTAVCEEAEWAALATDAQGRYTLIRAGIVNEGEAERLARSPQP